MLNRRTLLATALAGGLAAVAAQPAQAEWQDDLKVVKFGIVSLENQGDALTRYEGLVQTMEEQLGVDKVELFLANDYAGVVQALSAGQIHLALVGASAYASAYLDCNCVEPLVAVEGVNGDLGYYSVLFVRSDSPYKSLDELKGHSLAFGDPDSTSGYLVPLVSLRKAGIDPQQYFSTTAFSGGHEQSVLGVLKGTYESAFTWTSEGDRFGNIRTMVDKGMLNREDIRVIWKSDLIANPPIVARNDLPGDMKQDLQKFFTSLQGDDLEAAAQGEAKRFVPVDHDLYDPIVQARVELKKARKAQ
jgi:phosphonate transport system substrate-binding protein